jgi:hypothetical protein
MGWLARSASGAHGRKRAGADPVGSLATRATGAHRLQPTKLAKPYMYSRRSAAIASIGSRAAPSPPHEARRSGTRSRNCRGRSGAAPTGSRSLRGRGSPVRPVRKDGAGTSSRCGTGSVRCDRAPYGAEGHGFGAHHPLRTRCDGTQDAGDP